MGCLKSFPIFRIVTIVANFQDARKYTIRKQSFNIYIYITNRCLSAILEMVFSSEALRMGSLFIEC